MIAVELRIRDDPHDGHGERVRVDVGINEGTVATDSNTIGIVRTNSSNVPFSGFRCGMHRFANSFGGPRIHVLNLCCMGWMPFDGKSHHAIYRGRNLSEANGRDELFVGEPMSRCSKNLIELSIFFV
jgi:hypothetical protein